MRTTQAFLQTDPGTRRCAWFLRGRLSESATLQTVYIHTSPFVVGRLGKVSLCLASKVVSSRHAELLLRGEDLWIRDNNSTNGTYVNGSPLTGETMLTDGDLVQFANVAFRVGLEAAESNTNPQTMQGISVASDQAFSLVQFDKLMSESAVVPFFQPVVTLEDGNAIGYEVLGRSRFFGLQTPSEMFGAAMRLNMEAELSCLMRSAGMNNVRQLPPKTGRLFLNTHPIEVVRPLLLDSLTALRQAYPDEQLVLEIHEAAVTEKDDMLLLRSKLDELRIELAYDDFGSGQSRLRDLFDVPPDYLKFDMSLIRNIQETTPQQRDFVGGMVKMARELNIKSIAEGVETKPEHDVCRSLGFDLGQGFYYGKPMEAKHLPR